VRQGHVKVVIHVIDGLLDELLDADYEQAMADGQTFSVLSRRREPMSWSGRYPPLCKGDLAAGRTGGGKAVLPNAVVL
jgi:hypothetical protein